MRANTNLTHPRMTRPGSKEPCELPFCINTGTLGWGDKTKMFGLDKLGIAVSIYFKLLKSFIIFFLVCTLTACPLYYFYSSGNMSQQAAGQLQAYLSEWTLGNLGESSLVCKQNNLRLYDTLTLWCPSGTKIQSLEMFGLQKEKAEAGDNTCPQTVDDETQDLKLDLDEYCDLDGLELYENAYYKTLMQQFDKNCKGEELCDMYVRNVDWPLRCREKIGFRYQLVRVPVIRAN